MDGVSGIRVLCGIRLNWHRVSGNFESCDCCQWYAVFVLICICFQGKCESAYFIVVVHHLRTVVIAVRGTETPEDLITDGLGRECTLFAEDLRGLMKYASNSDSVALLDQHFIVRSVSAINWDNE